MIQQSHAKSGLKEKLQPIYQQRLQKEFSTELQEGASSFIMEEQDARFQENIINLVSPNNPFLPEIITKACNNEQEEGPYQLSSPSSITAKHSRSSSTGYQEFLTESRKSNLTLCLPSENQTPNQMQMFNPSSADRNYSIKSNNLKDLNTKRDEFLKATMKICLVVSPPSNKLQLKSKSLSHLDSLDTIAACQQRTQTNPNTNIDQLEEEYNLKKSQDQVLTNCNKICCLGSMSTLVTTNASSSPNQIKVLQGPIAKKKSSLMKRKKPQLTRSEASSSDYISVFFHTGTKGQEVELIAPISGITLAEALSGALKRRNLNPSEITISGNDSHFLSETSLESPPYATTIAENTDLELLAGKLLTITDKDCRKATTLQKAASFGPSTRHPRLLTSVSAEEAVEGEQKVIQSKQLKQRWSGLFGIKNPQQNQLCELLNYYAKNGVPQRMPPLHYGDPNFVMAIKYLENSHKSWRDFVEYISMSENEIKIQTAIWELVTTEIDYIHALQTVTNLFLACLEATQKENLLNDVDQNKLFSNIRDICECNLKLWGMYLYPMVEQSVSTAGPLSIDFFQQGFVNFASIFAAYKKYCADQSTCQFYCKELNRINSLFTAYLAWCESQKMCNRLRLADILVRPTQRLTKYSLLLTAIRKHVTEENDCDIMDSMIHSVENFVCSVNSHLTTRQENERLKGINARIEAYDVVDSSNDYLDKFVKQYCTMFDLCSPMRGCSSSHGRHLLMEGDLKFKDSSGKGDVHCFLLTDILLVCKTIAKKGQGALKVIRQPYLTDRLTVKHKENMLYCIYLNEFQTVTTAFTLQCSDAKSWHDALCKAKHIYSRLKQGPIWEAYNLRHSNNVSTNTADCLSIKKSPINSSFGSRVSSLNNSNSGSVELNDSRNISIDFEKTNSFSSDDGSIMSMSHSSTTTNKPIASTSLKLQTPSSNQLAVQPLSGLGQSLPNLNLNQSQTSNNTLLVPGAGSNHSGNILLSPSHRGISYPPPSPTRTALRRGFAFSSSIKNPPLIKTRNVTSQNSISLQNPLNPPTISPQQPQHLQHRTNQVSQQLQSVSDLRNWNQSNI